MWRLAATVVVLLVCCIVVMVLSTVNEPACAPPLVSVDESARPNVHATGGWTPFPFEANPNPAITPVEVVS